MPSATGSIGQFAQPGRVRIETGVTFKNLAVSEFLRFLERHGPGKCLGDQRGNLVHESVMIEADAIPFEHRELGVVQPPGLAVAEHLAELVDRTAARGQQPLHRKLRRGVQISGLAAGVARAGVTTGEARQIGVRVAAADSSGVSTSSTPRAEKNARMRSSIRARSLRTSSEVPGRQPPEAVEATGVRRARCTRRCGY